MKVAVILIAAVAATVSAGTQYTHATPCYGTESREDRNQRRVLQFYDAMFNRNDTSSIAEMIDPNLYIQHNPNIPNGPAGLMSFVYVVVHVWTLLL